MIWFEHLFSFSGALLTLSSLLAFLQKLVEALANAVWVGRKYWWQINMALTFS